MAGNMSSNWYNAIIKLYICVIYKIQENDSLKRRSTYKEAKDKHIQFGHFKTYMLMYGLTILLSTIYLIKCFYNYILWIKKVY